MSEFGCPPCSGNVLATNERWCGTKGMWMDRVGCYLGLPDWDNARYLFMMVDGRPLDGTSEWTEIVARVRAGIASSRFVCWEMAHLGIYHTVTMSAFGQIRTQLVDGRRVMNVKQGLISPLVHAIRLLALTAGCDEVSTRARCQWLGDHGELPSHRVAEIDQALRFGWRIRTLHHAEAMLCGAPQTDEVDVDHSSWLDREELLSHLESARWLERYIHRKFPKPR